MSFMDEVEPGWSTGNAYEAPRNDATVVNTLAADGQGVDSSGLNSGWGGFLQGTLDKVLSYGIQRDAAKSNVQLQAQQRQALALQPLVSRSGGSISVNGGTLLVIGAIVVAVMLVAHKGG